MNKILALTAASAIALAGCTTTRTERTTYYPDGTQQTQVSVQRDGYNPCADNEALGTVVGAVGGGVIGNQFGGGTGERAAATIGGAILGGIAGNAIGRGTCDNQQADAYYYNDPYNDAFEDAGYGRRYEWRNPHTGHYGYVTPKRNVDGYSYGYNDECREFEQIVYVDGQPYTDTGVACRDPDGTWRIVRS